MRILFALLLIAALLACGDFDQGAMFTEHVTAVTPGAVQHLRGGKVSCLHCPMYLMFDADPALITKIISEHKLHQVPAPSPEIRQIEELVKREAAWWQLANPAEQDKVFWAGYTPLQPHNEQAFRLLVIKGPVAFFVTSGHFNPASYRLAEL